MDSSVVTKNRSDMNDEGEDGEANSELEARLYAEIYYSNEIHDKLSPAQQQYGMTTINDVKNRWKNIADTHQGIKTSNLPTNNEISENAVDEPQPAVGKSPDSTHNIEVSQGDENNCNSKETNSENINKKMNSKKGQTPKKKKSQNVESVINESQDETDVPSLGKASKEKNKQAHETQSESESVANITNNDNTGTEVNKANKKPRGKKSKVCQNDPVTPSKQLSRNNKQQSIEEDSVSNKTIENERIISENPVTSDLSSSLNTLEEATEKTSSSKKRGTLKSKKKNSKSANVETSSSSNRTGKETLLKSKKSKQRSKQSKRKDDNDTAPLIILTSSDSSDTVTETHSKYKVFSKKSKMKEKQSSRNDIISDSDDSILEVPVPPKPTPPLINLQDSDEECGEIENVPHSPTTSLTNDDQLTTEKPIETADSESLPIPDVDTNQTVSRTGSLDTPVSTFETTSSESNDSQSVGHTHNLRSHATFETTSSESSNDSQPVEHTVLNDTALQTNPIAKQSSNAHSTPEKQPVIESEEDNIILNCTGIQRGASSLEEIKKMSSAAQSKQISSDDSMTESEANNWGKLAESRISLNESETMLSCVDRVSISENEVTTDNQKNVRHKKSKSRKSTDNSTTDSHDGNKEDRITEFSGSVTFNFQEDSNNQETNPTDSAQALMEDAEVHLEPAQGTSTEKNDPITIHTQASNKEKSPNKRKRSSDTAVSPSTSSKQARYSDAEAGPSSAGLETPKKKNVEKSSRRNCAADYFFLPMSDELKSFYNESWGGENFDIHKVQGDMPRDPRHWAILDADLCNPMRRQRYWSTLKCKQCHSDGHNKAACPHPKKVPCCHMCGKDGHTEPRCPEKKCLTCGRATSSYVKTCEYCRKLKCATCGSKGHEKSTCPDLWRRFHRTTKTLTVRSPGDNNTIMKPASQLHCCNCARRGHDYTDCVKYRWSQHFPTPSYVTNYTDGPHYISNIEKEVIEINDESFVNENNDRNADVSIRREKEPELEEIRNDTETEEENIIYTYTSRHVIGNPQVWKRTWNGTTEAKKCVVDGLAIPLFIQDIAEIVPLELTLSTGKTFYLKLTLRCQSEHLQTLKKVLAMWMKRDQVDKNQIIYKELPLQKSEMIHLLSNKLNEAKVDFGDPVDLLNEIENLKKQVKAFYIQGICNTQSKIATTRLTKLECRLVMSLLCQTRKGRPNNYKLSSITNAIDSLRNLKDKTIPPKTFLRIVLLFNKFFGHYVPQNAKKLANNKKKITQQHLNKCNKNDGNNKKRAADKTLRKNRAARNNLIATDVNHQNSALISNTETSSTNIRRSCSGDAGNLSYTITSDTPIEGPSTSTTSTHPIPSILDIHMTPQLLLPLPSLLKNPCNVNFMSNNYFVRPDSVGQENFLPLETARNDNNSPYNVPAQNLYQYGPSTGVGNCSGVQYQPFGTLGLPYESHLNNIHGAPYQLCYNNAPQNAIQTNQFPTGSLSHKDFVTDDFIRLGNNQVKDNAQSMQMQHQNPPANMINTPNTKRNAQPILKSKKAKRKERIRQQMLDQKNKKNQQGTKITKGIRRRARVAIQVAENMNVPRLTEAANALERKLNTGQMKRTDLDSLTEVIWELSSAKYGNKKK